MTTAKAGVCASLPARTSVIAAANPSGGHYTRAKTVAENLKLSKAMLSRFDITFLLLDRPDETLDDKLSEHILAMHAGQTMPFQNIFPSQHWKGVPLSQLFFTQLPAVHDALPQRS